MLGWFMELLYRNRHNEKRCESCGCDVKHKLYVVFNGLEGDPIICERCIYRTFINDIEDFAPGWKETFRNG